MKIHELEMNVIRKISFMLMAGTLSAVSCAVSDYDEAETPDAPYDLVISGSVMDRDALSPISGLTVLLYTYNFSDTQYSSFLGSPEVSVSDSRGHFSFSLEEVSSNVSYMIETGGTDSSGKTWQHASIEINVLSGSPSYDNSSNTYSLVLSPLYLDAE